PKAPARCPLGAPEHRLGDFPCSLFFRSLARLVAPIRQRVQRLPMAFVKWLFIVAAAGYLALGALTFFAQRALMYFPERMRAPPMRSRASDIRIASCCGANRSVRLSPSHSRPRSR